MLRLHLTSDDLAGLRVLPTLGPLLETRFSLGVLQGRGRELLFGEWRRQAAAHLTPADAGAVRLLFPMDGRGPLNIVRGAETVRRPTLDAVDDLLAAQEPIPRRRREDPGPAILISAADMAASPTPVRYPTGRDEQVHDRLLTAFTTTYRVAVRPYWQSIHLHLEARHAAAMHAQTRGGINELLSHLHPDLRWHSPVLEIGTPGPAPRNPADDLHLEGRGLILIGSVFCFTPTAVWSPAERTPVIVVYPTLIDVASAARIWHGSRPGTHRALAALLGTTRATILCLISDKPRTTSELAQITGTTPANTSQHATVLREAGLIATHRHHNTALHVLTHAGAGLLSAHSAAVDDVRHSADRH
ncbi:ArsR/SmtB family transcription factor [Actinomadura sp. 9N215]|uniref:ArsR/SmtB family transcription factor n=1 Tax=Actinomadura sp. 9N215 TaxID=3375150 RepID=UPI0037B6A521